MTRRLEPLVKDCPVERIEATCYGGCTKTIYAEINSFQISALEFQKK